MQPIIALAKALGWVNGALLSLGRGIGALSLGLMVVVILVQVFCRYVLNNALPWPEEASRFLMLWSTALMAPTAFRRGGFVSIDMVVRMLPRWVATLMATLMLGLMILVLWVALRIGWSEVTGLGGRFETDSLRVPVSLDLATWMKVPKSWMMASLLVGVALLLLVAVELALRSIVTLVRGPLEMPVLPEAQTLTAGAE